MITGNTSSILWELKNLNLNDFENRCITCTSGNPHNCTIVNDTVKTQRRQRITQIANSLILKGGDYYAIETNRPSEIIELDKQYYEIQKKNLKAKNISNACRLVILPKNILKDELINKRKELEQYVNYNIDAPHDDEKKISLKFIAFKSEIKEVFAPDQINQELYDFVISKKNHKWDEFICKIFKKYVPNYKITVFAQNKENVLSSFDSENSVVNVGVADKFYNAFNRLYLHKEEQSGNICYSKEINSFQELENFINSI